MEHVAAIDARVIAIITEQLGVRRLNLEQTRWVSMS